MPKRWRIPALLILGSLLAGAGLVEVVLRALDFSYYWASYKRSDAQRGWAPVPGFSGWQRMEGKAFVQINSAGFRDREHALNKPPNTMRIAVLGDSFAEAVQVPVEQTFWFVLERELENCAALKGRAAEVMNFGASGYSTAQEALTLRHRVWAYAPNMVLLSFFAGNDLVENLRALDGDPQRPYYVFRGGRLALDDGFLQSSAYRFWRSWIGRLSAAMIDHSRIAQAMLRARDLARLRRDAPPPSDAKDGAPQEPGVNNRIYRAPQDAAWKAAWQVTESLLAKMNRQAAQRGAGFIVVTLTTGAQVHPNPGFRAQFQASLGVDDLFYADRRIADLGARQGFPVLNLAPGMQFNATLLGAWLHGFENSRLGVGHWNSAGHRMAAELIGNALCQGGLFESPKQQQEKHG